MKDQNPLSPSDPTQFVTQLEGYEPGICHAEHAELHAGFGHHERHDVGSAARSWLPDPRRPWHGGAIGGAVEARQARSNLAVSVQDSTGATVDTFTVTPAQTGLTSFLWKGATSTGATAAAGTYTIGVTATVDGKTQTLTQWW